ncbi:hypothetical protein ACWEU6_36835 [Streptosporangium sandarakinum]
MLVDLAADGMDGLGVDDLRRRYGVRLAVGGPRDPIRAMMREIISCGVRW